MLRFGKAENSAPLQRLEDAESIPQLDLANYEPINLNYLLNIPNRWKFALHMETLSVYSDSERSAEIRGTSSCIREASYTFRLFFPQQ
jgi:hypothetical protein